MEDIGNRVYFVEMIGHELMKIGTAWVSILRVRSLRSWSPYELRLLTEAPGAEFSEAMVHDQFRHLRFRNEWFRIDASLRAFVERVRLDLVLPFTDMPNEGKTANHTMIGARRILTLLGMTDADLAAHLSLAPSAIGNWRGVPLPVRYGPAILRLAAAANLHIKPSDLFEPVAA